MPTRRTMLAMALAAPALAQTRWAPERAVTFLAPFAAGGSFDVTQRALARATEPAIGQPIAVINRTGAAGTIMLGELARARADGHVLGLLSTNTNAVAPQMMALPFNPLDDFTPLLVYGTNLTFIAVARGAPYTSLRDMIAFARREPGRLSVGVAAIGASSHLSFARLAAEERIDVTFVPFTGGAPAATSLLGGHIQCAVVAGEVLPAVRDGSLRLLGIMNDQKSEEFPDVPHMPELGYRWAARPWLGMGGPAGLPEPIAARWTEALLAATHDAAFLTTMRSLAINPLRVTRGEMRQLMADTLAESEQIARAIRIGRFAP